MQNHRGFVITFGSLRCLYSPERHNACYQTRYSMDGRRDRATRLGFHAGPPHCPAPACSALSGVPRHLVFATPQTLRGVRSGCPGGAVILRGGGRADSSLADNGTREAPGLDESAAGVARTLTPSRPRFFARTRRKRCAVFGAIREERARPFGPVVQSATHPPRLPQQDHKPNASGLREG